MIVMTFKVEDKKKRPVVVLGRTRGIATVSVDRGSIADAVRATMQKFKNDDDFLFVESGAVVRPPLKLFSNGNGFDVAAFVERIGCPGEPGPFDGIGRVSTLTLFFRRSRGSERVLERWKERNQLRPEVESENLLFTLSEVKDANFLHLPPEYCWIEESMRSFHVNAKPLIEHHVETITGRGLKPKIVEEAPAKEEKEEAERPPEVLWVGHLYQYTGYGKANREILFRIANTLNVRIDDSHNEPCYVNESLRVRLDAHKQILVGPKAPLLRFMGPDHIGSKERYRIVWTMMETSIRVHSDMVNRANSNFEEIWTPTEWNLQVFQDSGIRLPGRVMPLGVDPLMFRPGSRLPLPKCRLISTSRRGLLASPSGFIVLTVGLPGFRKGWDVIAEAFEKAFGSRKDAHFVIGLTHSPAAWNEKVYKEFSGFKSNIWTLEGSFDEAALARIYCSVNVYASASRGEGFNMPALEAAACGIPVVLPENTVHPEVFGSDAYYFPGEGVKKYPEGDWISDWYKGMLFTKFGKRSVGVLSEIFLELADMPDPERVASVRRRVIESFTWDTAAARVTKRLLEVQP